jgi:hypothetical protein
LLETVEVIPTDDWSRNWDTDRIIKMIMTSKSVKEIVLKMRLFPVSVLFFYAACCLSYSVSPFSPASLATDMSLSHMDFLCTSPDEYTSGSVSAVSRLVTTLPSSG